MLARSVIKHVVLIPDGNGRWVKRRVLPWEGRIEGVKALEKILKGLGK